MTFQVDWEIRELCEENRDFQELILLLSLNMGFVMIIELSGVQFVWVIMRLRVQFGKWVFQKVS